MNTVIIIGRTTSDIELKTTNSGKMVCSFTLAVPKNFKKDEANFIPVVFWEKQAEALKIATTAEKIQAAKALEESYAAEQAAEQARP